MKVLVAYGSQRGGTAEIAHAIGEELVATGVDVDVVAAQRELGMSGYDAVVVGGSLYMTRWNKDSARFVRANTAALADVPVWLFSSGPLDDSAHTGTIAPVGSVAKLMAKVDARGHATFGGRLTEDAEGFLASRMARTKSGDWRNFDDVRAWARKIAAELEAEPSRSEDSAR